MTSPDADAASVGVRGAVCVYAGRVDRGRAQCEPARLLGPLAVHAPRPQRAGWLADVLGVTTGALGTTVARLRTTIGPATRR